MKRQMYMILLALSCSCASLHATDWSDGNWWREQPEAFRLGYIHGYLDANSDAVSNEGTGPPPAGKKRQPTPTVELCDCTVGQLRDALDLFYEDPANRLIVVGGAIKWVSSRVRGEPEAKLNEDLRFMRRLAIGLRKTCQDHPELQGNFCP